MSSSAQDEILAAAQKYDGSNRVWEREKPLLERMGARVGLQGNLILCFMGLLTLALGASSVIYMSQTQACLSDILGEQAQQIASSLAWTTEHSLAQKNHDSEQLTLAAGN